MTAGSVACRLLGVLLLIAGGLALATSGASAQTEVPPHLRVVTKSLPPFVITGDSTPQGFSMDLLDKLAARLDFTYELQVVDTVAEQLQRVQNGEADLAIAGISMTSEREGMVDFTYPMFHSGLQILTSTSDEGAAGTSQFQTVWPLFAQLLLLLVVVAHLVWLIRSRNDESFPKGYLRGIGEGLWFASESMATVGYGERRPRTLWGHLAAVFWMFLAIFIVANLTGSISADLVGQQIQGTINGPDDLPGKRVGTVAGTTSAEYLESRDLTAVEAGSIEAMFDLLNDGEVDAVVMDSPVLRYYAADAGAGLVRLVGPVFSLQDYGIALPTGSPLREEVNRALLGMIEDGSYERLEESWFGDG
jgi:polar amino acid transport system substrate-binding protein